MTDAYREKTKVEDEDINLIIGDWSINVVKKSLIALSEYLKVLFEGEFADSSGSDVDISKVTNNKDAVKCLVQFVHHGEADVNSENVEELFKISVYFQVQCLIEICEKYLKDNLNIANCVDYIALGRTYSRSDVEVAANVLLKGRFYECVMFNGRPLDIPPEILLEWLEKDYMKFCECSNLLSFIAYWLMDGLSEDHISVALKVLHYIDCNGKEMPLHIPADFQKLEEIYNDMNVKLVDITYTAASNASQEVVRLFKEVTNSLGRHAETFDVYGLETLLFTVSKSETDEEVYEFCAYDPQCKIWYFLTTLTRKTLMDQGQSISKEKSGIDFKGQVKKRQNEEVCGRSHEIIVLNDELVLFDYECERMMKYDLIGKSWLQFAVNVNRVDRMATDIDTSETSNVRVPPIPYPLLTSLDGHGCFYLADSEDQLYFKERDYCDDFVMLKCRHIVRFFKFERSSQSFCNSSLIECNAHGMNNKELRRSKRKMNLMVYKNQKLYYFLFIGYFEYAVLVYNLDDYAKGKEPFDFIFSTGGINEYVTKEEADEMENEWTENEDEDETQSGKENKTEKEIFEVTDDHIEEEEHKQAYCSDEQNEEMLQDYKEFEGKESVEGRERNKISGRDEESIQDDEESIEEDEDDQIKEILHRQEGRRYIHYDRRNFGFIEHDDKIVIIGFDGAMTVKYNRMGKILDTGYIPTDKKMDPEKENANVIGVYDTAADMKSRFWRKGHAVQYKGWHVYDTNMKREEPSVIVGGKRLWRIRKYKTSCLCNEVVLGGEDEEELRVVPHSQPPFSHIFAGCEAEMPRNVLTNFKPFYNRNCALMKYYKEHVYNIVCLYGISVCVS